MKHFFLKFTHGVEIGAALAYLGHWKRTGDVKVMSIYVDELHHKYTIQDILSLYDQKPNKLIDASFKLIGTIIKWMCAFSPIPLLDNVARLLEVFAVVSYDKLADMYPEHRELLLEMAQTERDHEEYFKSVIN